MRIVDDEGKDLKPSELGEIVFKSISLMAEYWNNPDDTEKTLIDRWLHTGKIGYNDVLGNIYIVDR